MGWPSPVVTEYPWPGLGAHPIYWICVDALAVAKVVAELRNWLHHGTCKLMYTRGGLGARSLGGMGPGAMKPREDERQGDLWLWRR